MKDKGFTLIELIAVVVIMGMLLLIVFPATSRLMRSNENKRYDTYYDSVQEQLELYARTRRDELGGINGSGCIDDTLLSDLNSPDDPETGFDYVKQYKEEKNITCHSPGEFSTDRLQALGIDFSKSYANIKIINNKGKMKVEYSMICVKHFDNPEKMSIVYKKLVENDSTCEHYVPEVTNSLLNAIRSMYTVETKNEVSYLTGNPNNNYVWYSGKMWRIISFNANERTVKLVTDDIVSIVNYNIPNVSNVLNNDYSSSNIFNWLKTVFLPTLRNSDRLLENNVSWNYSAVAADLNDPIIGGSSVRGTVGMLDNYEYKQGKNFLNKGKNFWLISTSSESDSAWMVDTSGNIVKKNVATFYGVRPTIVLKPNVKYVSGGDGTELHPFKIIGDSSANVGAKLNSRIPGEYVLFNNSLFRISSVDASYTKLIAMNTIPLDEQFVTTIDHIKTGDYNLVNNTIAFHFFDKKYTNNTFIGSCLMNWVESDKEKLVPAPVGEGAPTTGRGDGIDFCTMTITNNTSLLMICPQEDIIKTNIAVPKIGELYVGGANRTYWTINNETEDKVNVINPDYSVSSLVLRDEEGTTIGKAAILPVVAINNEVEISGGNGTPDSPYTLQYTPPETPEEPVEP